MTTRISLAQLLLASWLPLLAACGDKEDPVGSDSGLEEADTDTDTDSDTDVDATYTFEEGGLDDYARVDRLGMPAVATALISSKDAYNEADPTDDANLAFAGEIIASLGAIHGILDDDLAAFGLTPCTVVGDGSGSCVAQGAPLVLPDTLAVDLTAESGFPNGRLLEDPVIDVTLAVVLLDLSVHSPGTFVGLLNPPANDVAFQAGFPYLAAPN